MCRSPERPLLQTARAGHPMPPTSVRRWHCLRGLALQPTRRLWVGVMISAIVLVPAGKASARFEDGGGRTAQASSTCVKPPGVQRVTFSKSAYPNIRRHFRRAHRRGWPRRLVVNRPGADARRDRLMRGRPTRRGYDRDEYPPAIGRGRGKGLTRGRNPRGWRASVAYVPSSENRSHGAALGGQLRGLCNGTRFRYVFE